MDLAQKFEWVALDKTISVTELDPIVNIVFSGLRDLQLDSVPLWCSISGTQWRPCSGLPA